MKNTTRWTKYKNIPMATLIKWVKNKSSKIVESTLKLKNKSYDYSPIREAVGEMEEDWYDKERPQSHEWYKAHIRNELRKQILKSLGISEK